MIATLVFAVALICSVSIARNIPRLHLVVEEELPAEEVSYNEGVTGPCGPLRNPTTLVPTCTEINGDLVYYADIPPVPANFSVLTYVQGQVVLYNINLMNIYFPVLQYIGNNLAVTLSRIHPTVYTFPALTGIGGYLNFNNNPHMTLVAFPVLTFIGGDGDYAFLMYNNTNLAEIVLPVLSQLGLGDVWFCGNLNNTCIVPPALINSWSPRNLCSFNENPLDVTCPDVWTPCNSTFTC